MSRCVRLFLFALILAWAAVADSQVTQIPSRTTLPSLTVSGGLTAATITGTTSVTIGTTGSPTPIIKIRVFSPSLTPTQIAAAIGEVEQLFTVSGVNTSDIVIVNVPSTLNSLCPMTAARVSALDQVALRFANLTVALCTPASGTYPVIAIRS